VKVATGALAARFSILALMIFLFKISFKKNQNRRFCAWASRSGFGAAICAAVVCSV